MSLSETFTHDIVPLYSQDYPVMHLPVTVLSGQTLSRGAVLGRITASGKYVLSDPGTVDGSETPRAVLAEGVDASGGDVVAPAYFSGCFNPAALTFGGAHDAASVADAFLGSPLFLRATLQR